jgi:hypothetical protein
VHLTSDSHSSASGIRFYATRQNLSLVSDRKPREDDALFKDAVLTEAAPELTAKDVGPQCAGRLSSSLNTCVYTRTRLWY